MTDTDTQAIRVGDFVIGRPVKANMIHDTGTLYDYWDNSYCDKPRKVLAVDGDFLILETTSTYMGVTNSIVCTKDREFVKLSKETAEAYYAKKEEGQPQ